MNPAQIQATLGPVLGMAAGYFAAWWGVDQATALGVLTALCGFVASAYAAWITRNTALKDQVGNMPATTVITDRQSAAALPNNPDVVASTPEIVAAIKKAS